MPLSKAKLAIVPVAVLLATVTIFILVFKSQDREAKNIMDQVYRKYASLSSYTCTGSTVEEIGGGPGKTLTASFSLRFGRPNYYLVEYEQQASHFTNKGAVWSDGSGEYFSNDRSGQTTRWPSEDLTDNLHKIADVSGGVTAVLPALFFEALERKRSIQKRFMGWIQNRKVKPDDWFQPARWNNFRLVKDQNDKVGETDCYVLSAEFNRGKAMLWIGKKDLLIHRSQEWVRGALPEATDAEVTRILNTTARGLQAPLSISEMKRKINEAREEAEATMKPVTVEFTKNHFKNGQPVLSALTEYPPPYFIYTQTYENNVVNQEFTPTNFTRKKAPLKPGDN